jgi:hypothetical protein
VEEQHREDSPLLTPAERKRTAFLHGLKRPEESKVDHDTTIFVPSQPVVQQLDLAGV